MKSINIRSLKHQTGAVMKRIALGESLEIRRRDQPIAVLQPVGAAAKSDRRPDFRARLERIYGESILEKTGTDLISETRGDR